MAPTIVRRIQPRFAYQRLAHMNGHNTTPTPKPMPLPIDWKTRVKKFTIGSNIRSHLLLTGASDATPHVTRPGGLLSCFLLDFHAAALEAATGMSITPPISNSPQTRAVHMQEASNADPGIAEPQVNYQIPISMTAAPPSDLRNFEFISSLSFRVSARGKA